jgi:uncharacterized membrane protein
MFKSCHLLINGFCGLKIKNGFTLKKKAWKKIQDQNNWLNCKFFFNHFFSRMKLDDLIIALQGLGLALGLQKKKVQCLE